MTVPPIKHAHRSSCSLNCYDQTNRGISTAAVKVGSEWGPGRSPSLVAGCWLLVASFLLLVACCLLLVAGVKYFTGKFLISSTYYHRIKYIRTEGDNQYLTQRTKISNHFQIKPTIWCPLSFNFMRHHAILVEL